MIGVLIQEQAPPIQRGRPWWLVLLSTLAWLVLAAIVRRATATIEAAMLLGVAALLGVSDQILARAGCGLSSQRKVAGHALAVTVALCLTLVLVGLRGRFSMTADVLAFLLAVIVVALVGGFVPAVLEAVAGSLLLYWFVAAQPGPFAADRTAAAAYLGVFAAAATLVGLTVEDAARRSQRAARTAEADQARAAGLSAVSDDLRASLTTATAAVNCLRSPGAQLTAEDHDELLAAAGESLGQLTYLLASLLDAS